MRLFRRLGAYQFGTLPTLCDLSIATAPIPIGYQDEAVPPGFDLLRTPTTTWLPTFNVADEGRSYPHACFFCRVTTHPTSFPAAADNPITAVRLLPAALAGPTGGIPVPLWYSWCSTPAYWADDARGACGKQASGVLRVRSPWNVLPKKKRDGEAHPGFRVCAWQLHS